MLAAMQLDSASASEFVDVLWKERASAILRSDGAETAALAMQAAIRAGFRVVEVTLTTPGALELVSDLARDRELWVGVGTVLRAADAIAAVRAGARFLVSPVVDEAVIAQALELGVAVLPGTHTPTEMLRAHRAGAPLVKLFPAPAGGPAYVRSCLGPLPFLRIVPTNGVDAENIASWLEAGAWAVGLVASLFAADDMAAGRWDRIEERARSMLARAKAVPRGEPPARRDPFEVG